MCSVCLHALSVSIDDVHMHLHTLPPCTIEDAVIKELVHFFPRCITDSSDLFLANYLPRLLREGVLGPGHG